MSGPVVGLEFTVHGVVGVLVLARFRSLISKPQTPKSLVKSLNSYDTLLISSETLAYEAL